ncbi:MAG TPA: immunoglobulin domain-containing protein, partial [Verrucomicrobiae bacterium]|nr:immunoglobulin domain-containing protein [Verrucomicrobiae bacterium]
NGVIVYEGTDPVSVLDRMASDNSSRQLSCSWGWGETTPESIFLEFATQGQSFFAASGDSGAYVGTNFILTPSDDPNITIVGGTTLITDSSVNYLSERVWNWLPGQEAASSGGVSQTYPIPSWQQGISMTSNLGSTANRNIPDVALTADNIYIVADNGFSEEVGGTSAAAPLWAGLTALINQQAIASGETNVGFLNPALYAIGKGSNYLLNFHDITTGNDTNLSSSPFYPATTGFDLCTGWGTPAGTNLINTLAPPVFFPRVVAGSTALAAENCLPTNGAIDPGETVTVIFNLKNIGTASTTNLVVTLLTNAGVSPSGGPQNYGVIPLSGGTAGRAFTFTANGTCGEIITASLQLQDGPTNYGILNFAFPLGLGSGGLTTFSQNFDGVPAPLLPSGWTTSHSGGEPAWVTSTASRDTSPNAAFAKENSSAGLTQLISPAISINLATAQVKFRQSFNTDTGFDGGILTISINGGAYEDIVAAGGSFATNGYTATLGDTSGNPIGGMQAWTGSSGGFITTIANLPPSAAGQTIRLNWQFGTDSFQNGSGWYVDTVSILDGSYTCCTGSADMAVTQTASPNPAVAGQNLTYTLSLTNIGDAAASGVTVTDVLPAGVTFVSASPGATNLGGTVVAAPGTIASGAGTSLQIIVQPAAAGSITNVATVATTGTDSNPANNSSSLVNTVDALPVITTGPSNVTVVAGGTVTFSAAGTGEPAPVFQWFFNGTTPVGGNSSLLALTNVQPSQAGDYSVRLTNIVGSTNSTRANLIVDTPPVITAQPSNQVFSTGGNVNFTVTATGVPAPVYQWFFNTTTPVGGNSSVLTLANVQPSQAGIYTVLVTNSAGSTNSAQARLTLLQPPDITSISVTRTNVSISFPSMIGLNYTLEYKNLLTDPGWNLLSPSTPGTGGLLTLHDTNSLPLFRFYRILCD